MAIDNERWMPTRQSLLHRLKDWDDQESWRDFFNTYSRLIYGVARKAGLTDSEAEEVVQETVVSVAKSIGKYTYDPGVTFKGWLRYLTGVRIVDQFRKRPRLRLAESVLPEEMTKGQAVEQLPDPAGSALDAVWEEEWRSHLQEAALEKLKEQVSIAHYQIFYLSVIREMAPREVAKALGVNVGRVYLVRHRLGRLYAEARRKVEQNAG